MRWRLYSWLPPDPPALVLCVDEKSQGTVQGLDRSQPLFADAENQGRRSRRQPRLQAPRHDLSLRGPRHRHEEEIARQLECFPRHAAASREFRKIRSTSSRANVACSISTSSDRSNGSTYGGVSSRRQPDRSATGVIANLTRRAGRRGSSYRPPRRLLAAYQVEPLARAADRARLEANGDLIVLQPFRRRQDESEPAAQAPATYMRRRQTRTSKPFKCDSSSAR